MTSARRACVDLHGISEERGHCSETLLGRILAYIANAFQKLGIEARIKNRAPLGDSLKVLDPKRPIREAHNMHLFEMKRGAIIRARRKESQIASSPKKTKAIEPECGLIAFGFNRGRLPLVMHEQR